MKKKILYILFTLFIMLGVTNVNALTCDLETKTKLRIEAANVSVSYEPVDVPAKEDPNAPEDLQGAVYYYLDMKVYNVNSRLRVKVIDQSQGDYTREATYKNIGADGAVTFRKSASNKTANVRFEIYGSSSTGCSSTLLRTIKLTLPKYNNLAEREVCADVPEFYMCQKYITYDINPANFKVELDEYKKRIEKQDASLENNNTITSQVAKVVSNNKFLFVGLVIAVGVGITIYVLNKKRSES